MTGPVEFDEFAARSAARLWTEVGAEMKSIAAAASAITDGPWGGGKLGDAFSKGEGGNKGFVANRNDVQKAGNELTTYLESYGPNLTDAANLFAEQSKNRTPRS